MDVLIINPPVRLSDKPRHIPHGLAIVANVLRKKLDICPTFLDINAHRYGETETKSIIEKMKFDVVLIGGLITTYASVVSLSKFIKFTNPDAKIVAGGSVAMPIPEVLLKNSAVDTICMGEGEVTIVELLNKFKKDLSASLDGIAGICYKKGGHENEVVFTKARPLIQDIDSESELPAYDLLPMDIYLSNPVVGIGRDVDFISSRGCPYSCSFCYQPWGRRFRAYSVDFVIKAITYLRGKYGIEFISFQDDEFMANKARIYEFCEKRDRFLPDLLWSCTGRVNLIDDDIVKMMRNSGCVLISYGFESGSQRILDSMNKMQKIEQMERAVQISRSCGMPIPASFIIGMPGEDSKSCQETLDFCIRNNLPLDSLMFATPYPGTQIYDFALRTGRIDKNHIHEFVMRLGDARDFVINLTDHFSDEELTKKRKEMMEKAKENYESFITQEEIIAKMKSLYGSLLERHRFDEKDLEHRAQHGGISTF
ncbi:MAG: radical SAM protein [Dehalococcoidia bacterium]